MCRLRFLFYQMAVKYVNHFIIAFCKQKSYYIGRRQTFVLLKGVDISINERITKLCVTEQERRDHGLVYLH